jgi:hypothetical protein
MTLYEFLTVALSAGALYVSYRTSKRQTALEQSQARLVEAQRKALARDEEVRARADVRCRILKGAEAPRSGITGKVPLGTSVLRRHCPTRTFRSFGRTWNQPSRWRS